MQHVKMLYLFVILFTVLGACTGEGGPCYSRSQKKCRIPFHNLWSAKMEGRDGAICGYFKDLHKCTMDFQATCKFKDDLYETDIVNVYTRKPYSCQLMGGNIRYNGEYDANSAKRFQLSTILMMILNLVPLLHLLAN
ncbi:uncharacterized protein LOC132743441 [Ruditapes philippinarum]|uniref:uncharacterized protein LOC132743441 n=1 Tax=Ruditapes philippinarum TaxID=129788 RepID=UPI00295ABA54|nr:uncharacterized protein LOC132743441 [Ruditapes philippinarum]